MTASRTEKTNQSRSLISGDEEVFVPGKMFFTKGVGRHKDYLQSFELALRDAGIEKCNIVTVSSIYPPGCKRISKEEGTKLLQPGGITFCVMARNATNEPNRLIAASIGVAQPSDATQYGYLSEHHPFGETDEKAGEYAEDLAATMLATTLGIEFDFNTAWDEREKIYKMSGKIVKTFNVTQSAEGDKNGLWTTVIASAVLFPPDEKQLAAAGDPTVSKEKSAPPVVKDSSAAGDSSASKDKPAAPAKDATPSK